MILATVLLLTASTSALKGDEIARSRDGALTLSVLPKDLVEKEIQGCSCAFRTAKASRGAGRLVLAWEFGGEGRVPVQINGQTRRLKVISETSPNNTGEHTELRKGDQTLFTLAGEETRVLVDCRATSTCAESSSESCEGSRYDCSVAVDSVGARVVLPVSGECGC